MSNMVILKPRLSEKAYSLSEKLNTYIFDVPKSASKSSIASAVAAQYEVTVDAVRVATVRGKKQRTYRRGGRKVLRGQRSDIRKAYVTLKEGDVLPLFAATDEDKGKVAKEAK